MIPLNTHTTIHVSTRGMTKIPSSWIHSIWYRRTRKVTYLAIFLHCEDRHSAPVALLYSNVPSWMPGLISAGLGGKSIGRAYNALLKRKEVIDKYGIQYQRVEGRENVRQLKEMMR